MTPEFRYVVCTRCGRVMSWLEHSSLHVAVDCTCGAEKRFGPGVYRPEFKGYGITEVQAMRARLVQRNAKPAAPT